MCVCIATWLYKVSIFRGKYLQSKMVGGGVGNQSLVVVLGPQLDISTIAMEGNAWASFIFFCNKQIFLLSFKSLLLTLPAGTKPRSALKSFFHVHKTVVSPRVPALCKALPPPSSEGVKS